MGRDPIGGARILNRLPQRDQRGEQEHSAPTDRLIGFINRQHAAQDHTDSACQQAQGQTHIGKQDQRQGHQEEHQSPTDLMRTQFFLRKIRGHDHKILVRLQTGQTVPLHMHHRRITRLQRHSTNMGGHMVLGLNVAQSFSTAMNGQQRQPMGGPQPQINRRATNHA